MRARWALLSAGLLVQWREVDLKSKPPELLDVSPKGTVPVLTCVDGTVLEESLEIMKWALGQSDPFELIPISSCEKFVEINRLIVQNDQEFKQMLDRYKYTDRYPGERKEEWEQSGLAILEDWSTKIEKSGWLVGDSITLADIAIWPFVRQWYNTDPVRFAANVSLESLFKWLERFTKSVLFDRLMIKSMTWDSSIKEKVFPADASVVRRDQPLFHLALNSDWQEAKLQGVYSVSTLGMQLKQVGFIHASWEHQVRETYDRFYSDFAEVTLLTIDPSCLAIPLRADAAVTGEFFPHLYGPLPISAVVKSCPYPP